MAKKQKRINHVETIPDPEVAEAIPVPAVAPVEDAPEPSVHTPKLVPYGNGQWAAEDMTRDLMVWVDGVRYEHVAETPDGRWVYAKS